MEAGSGSNRSRAAAALFSSPSQGWIEPSMSTEPGRSRPAEILLVEDNENDVILTRMGFKRAKLPVNLQHVKDGEECMAFLRKQEPYARAPTPDLILLDLNMPRMSGQEVLAAMANDENLRHIPTVILTTSSDEQEILETYKLRCSSYIVKPVNFDEFLRLIQVLVDYWLTVVVLPTGSPQRSY
jgi:two-component system response regulator